MTPTDEIYRLTSANRLILADVLAGLSDEQWQAGTLCDGWRVREMAGHLLQPVLVGFGRFFVTAIRYRGDSARTVDHFARRLGQRSRRELVRLMRAHAADRVDPPRVGAYGPFAETCVHLRDVARPLGLAIDVPVEHWRTLLDYLTSPGAAPGLVRPGTTEGLRLVATDADWAAGDGPEVAGPAEALGMAVTGRAVALDDLRGDGVSVLRRRR